MKRFSRLLISSVLLIGFAIYGGNARANAITITANTNWSAITTGSGPGNAPSATDTITVQNGSTLTVNVTNALCASLQLGGSSGNGNGTLSFLNSTSQLTVSGTVTFGSTAGSGSRTGSINMTNGGTLSAGSFAVSNLGTWTPGSGTLILTMTSTMPTSISTFNNLSIASATTTLPSATTLSGTLSISSGATLLANGITVAGTTNISGSMPVSNSGTYTFTGLVTVNSGGLWSSSLNTTITFAGGITNNGSFNSSNSGGSVTISGGNLTNNGTFSASGTVIMSGTTAQTIAGSVAPTFTNLTINNTSAAGITLGNNITVSNTLTLTDGVVNTGSDTLITSFSCTSSNTVGNTNSFVNGNVQLKFPVGGKTCTFPVGTGVSYTPMTITTPTLSTGGTLTGSTIGNEHPQISSSGIDSANDANRYWTLGASGDSISASSYSATFTFVAGDLDATATTTNFIVGAYANGTWTLPTVTAAAATSTSVGGTTGSGLTGLPTPTSFAVGDATFVCSVPSNLPSNMTCVCDNFGRSNVNPSTIFGDNYTLTESSGTAGWPQIATSGYLQLTNNSTNMSTSVTLPGTFPAAGNLITVEFKDFSYSGNGADGLALTLSDSSIAPTPGAYGGSLGFAQKTVAGGGGANINGFTGGWVGIGLDEFGNYSNPTEGRIGGPGATADAIAIRGSGSGLTGYPYVKGTGTLSPGIDTTSTTRGPGYTYQVTVDARCYQNNGTYQSNNTSVPCNNPSLAKTTSISVGRDTTGGTNYASLVSVPNIYTVNTSQASVPTNWKLSFTSSTGSNVNIHEITGLRVCAQTITPPSGFLIQIDNLTPSTCGTPGDSPASPIVTITAVDANGNVITTYTNTITLSATISGTSPATTSSAVWRRVGAATNLTGNQYTFTAADNGVAQFYLTDTTAQSVIVNVTDGTLSGTSGTPIVYSSTSFNIVNSDPFFIGSGAVDTTGGGVVAGHAHLFKVTEMNGCTVATTYTGNKNLASWYTPTTSHPTGAGAPQLCQTNSSNTCLPTTGSCQPQTLSIAPPTVGTTNYALAGLPFTKGVANFCLVTTDVGQYSISLRDDAPTTPINGSSTTLTVRPFAIAITNIVGTVANPATNTDAPAVSSAFITKAGSNFQATVGGYLWKSTGTGIAGIGDSTGDGLPDTTATSSILTNGLTSSYADTITLSANTSGLHYPSAGIIGTLSGTVAVTNGSATDNSLSYSEVGSVTMKAASTTATSPGYLNSGVNLSNRIVFFSTYLTGSSTVTSQNALVGRFIPDHFTLTPSLITNRSDINTCSSSTFTYMGEPLQTSFTLTAKNLADAPTTNYFGNYAMLGQLTQQSQLALAFNVGANVGITPPLTSMTSRVTPTLSSPAFATNPGTGSANVTIPIVFARNATPDGDYGISNTNNAVNFGVKPIDPDGVTVATSALNLDTTTTTGTAVDHVKIGNTAIAFGIFKVENAYGSELINLPIPVQATYWNGTSFVKNRGDSCTSIATNSSVISLTPHLTSGTTSPVNSTVKLNNGISDFQNSPNDLLLSAPGAGSSGYVDLNVTVPSYLLGNPSTGYTSNPTARATFGIYKNPPVIYLREQF